MLLLFCEKELTQVGTTLKAQGRRKFRRQKFRRQKFRRKKFRRITDTEISSSVISSSEISSQLLLIKSVHLISS